MRERCPTAKGSTLDDLPRSPLPILLGVTALSLVALAISPLAAVVVAGVLVIAGVVLRARGDAATGLGLAATGGALFLAAVLVLVLVDAEQDEPVILSPETGLIPGP